MPTLLNTQTKTALEAAKRWTAVPPAGSVINFDEWWAVRLCVVALSVHGIDADEAETIARQYTGDPDTRYAAIADDYDLHEADEMRFNQE